MLTLFSFCVISFTFAEEFFLSIRYKVSLSFVFDLETEEGDPGECLVPLF